MSDHPLEPKDEAPAKGKKYSPPTLTEYGSVAKLTMAKGSTAFEFPNQKKSCL